MRVNKAFVAARVLATLAAAVMATGCATKGDIRSLREDLRDLAIRQDSLLQQVRVDARSTQDTVRQQSDQLFDFRGDISRQLQQMNQSLSRLEAMTGENQRAIVGVRDQLANLRRLPTGPSGAVGEPSMAGGGGEGTAPGVGAGGAVEDMFNAGVQQFNRGSNTAARAAFESFLQAYPNDPLAPDAHYYLADILVQDNRVEDALAAFKKIPELFPTATKVPDALYRIGLLQIELGQKSEARATLTRVVNTYPNSGVATLASEKLKELGS